MREHSSDPAAATPPQAKAAKRIPDEIRQFGHYTLLQELGRGAQGVVYLAEDRNLHRKVALKMLSSAGAQSDATRWYR
jgi:serine/threonine protein kinase